MFNTAKTELMRNRLEISLAELAVNLAYLGDINFPSFLFDLPAWSLETGGIESIGSQRRKINIFQYFVFDTLSWQPGLSHELSLPAVSRA